MRSVTGKQSRYQRLQQFMGSAFSRGNGDHLPPMKAEGFVSYITETQADNLRPEVVAELVDEEPELWEDPEGGLVKLTAPQKGKMVRVRVTGQATIYLGSDGKINLLNPNGY